MADGFFPTLVSKDANANAVANPIVVQLSDGTDTLPIDATTGIPVNVTNASIAVTATDLDIRDLSSATDSVTVVATDLDIRDLNSATDSVAVTDGGGSITVDGSVSITGSVTVTATDLDIRDLNSATDSVTVVATDLDIRDLSSATDSVTIADGGGSITVDGSVTVSATDLDIRDLTLATDAVRVSANSTANGVANPIYVSVVAAAAITGEVHDQKTVTALAANTTDNHDYTVVTAMRVQQFTWASSGASKAQLIVNGVTVATGFIPKQGGVEEITLATPVEAAATQVVRIAVTNRENTAQDVYSTIVGIDA
jgi:hypothetical protein